MSQVRGRISEGLWLLPWLAAAAILAVGLVFGPALQAQTRFESPDPTANDAPIGTQIQLPARDVHGWQIDPLARTLLVYAGTCSGCSDSGIGPERIAKARFPQVILLNIVGETRLEELYPRPRQTVFLVADPAGAIVQQLGAMTAPRLYVLENSRIVEIWKDTISLPTKWTGETNGGGN